jgi:hypothetical protein
MFVSKEERNPELDIILKKFHFSIVEVISWDLDKFFLHPTLNGC